MARERHTPEQVLAELREVGLRAAEVELASGRVAGEVSRKIGVTEQTYDPRRSTAEAVATRLQSDASLQLARQPRAREVRRAGSEDPG